MIRFLKNHFIFVVIAVACCSAIVFFYPYFLKGKVLFPSNLLVSTYNPWKITPDLDYPNGPPNKPIGFDNIRQLYPNRKFTQEEFAKGKFPLWNPYVLSGTPYAAIFDTAIVYIPNILFQILPLIDAWSVMVMIQPILSMCFMFLFLKSIQRSNKASLLGAFAYAFAGWMIVYWEETLLVEHSFLWLPLALYASNCIWDRTYIRGIIFLICALVFNICAGFFQMTIYVYGTVVAWNCYRYWRERKDNTSLKKGILIGVGLLIPLCISAIQLIPSIESYIQSPRNATDVTFLFREYLAPLQHLITLIAPDFWGNPGTYNYFGGKAFYFEKMIFMGIVPLVFTLYGFIKAKEKYSIFWKLFGGITFLLGFALPTGWLPYILHIPILASSYPTRIFALSLFAFSVISAFAFDDFRKKQDFTVMRNICIVLGMILLLAWGVVLGSWIVLHKYIWVISLYETPVGALLSFFGTYKDLQSVSPWYLNVSSKNLIIPTGFFIGTIGLLISIRFSKKIFFILTFLMMFVSSFYFSYKYIYFSERKFTYPDRPIMTVLKDLSGYDRVWGYGNAFFEKNILQYYRIFSTDGYTPLLISRYAELLNTIQHEGKIMQGMRRSDIDIFEASEKEAFGKSNPYRLRMMSLLGIKYIVETKKGPDKDHKTTEDRFPDDVFLNVYEDDTWRIWEYTKVLPRAFFASSVRVIPDDQKLLDTIYDEATDLRHTIFTSSGESIGNDTIENKEQYEGVVHITAYESSKVELSVEAPERGAVFLSDTYYPGWKATVDGKETEIIEADYAFRAVIVPKGNHIVVFEYKPKSFSLAMIISGLGFLSAICIALYVHRWNMKKT